MKKLDQNWFVEDLIDFEFQKYRLLAYLKEVQEQYQQAYLFPVLSDLVGHYRSLREFREGTETLSGHFPRKVSGLDWENKRLIYEAELPEPDQLREVEMIVDYSLPRIKAKVEEGKEIYELVEGGIAINSVGILPLYKQEGYLLVRKGANKEIKAYHYQMSIIEGVKENLRSLRTEFVEQFRYGFSTTLESIKINLIKTHKVLPNPATYFVESRYAYPEKATLMPVVKRKFIRYLSSGQ